MRSYEGCRGANGQARSVEKHLDGLGAALGVQEGLDEGAAETEEDRFAETEQRDADENENEVQRGVVG